MSFNIINHTFFVIKRVCLVHKIERTNRFSKEIFNVFFRDFFGFVCIMIRRNIRTVIEHSHETFDPRCESRNEVVVRKANTESSDRHVNLGEVVSRGDVKVGYRKILCQP